MAKKSNTGAHRGLSGFTTPKRGFRPAYSKMDPTCAVPSFCHLARPCKQHSPMKCAQQDMRAIYLGAGNSNGHVLSGPAERIKAESRPQHRRVDL